MRSVSAPNVPGMPDTMLAPPARSAAHCPEWLPPAVLLPELGPAAPVDIAAAPAAPEFERGWLSALLPALSALGMLGFALLSPNVIIVAIMGGVAIISTVGMVYTGRVARRRHERQWVERCLRYRRHLARCEQVLNESAHRQLVHASAAHPAPNTATIAVAGGRFWEGSPPNNGLRLRVGSGRASARRPPSLRDQAADAEGDPELQREAAALMRRCSAVDAIPICIDLPDRSVAVLEAELLPALRAMVVSLTRAYRPDVLRLHVLAAPAESSWLQQLPHAATVAGRLDELRLAFRAHPLEAGPHHVLIDLTGDALTVQSPLALLGDDDGVSVSLLALQQPDQPIPTTATLVLETTPEEGLLVTRPAPSAERQSVPRPDALSFAQAQEFARALSRHSGDSCGSGTASVLLLQPLLDPPVAHPLMIPIGLDEDDERVLLDLREAASGGHGPHGIIIGSTGSGKSELLRTLLVAAAHQSSPTELALLLIDYKGGAAFAELSKLPHVAGLLTNLSADPAAVDRMCASLRAELRRRQQLLRTSGKPDIDSYRADPHEEPLPRLLVVVDEYAELIEESPETLEVLTSLGRLGRSLGIHLLLSSQRLDDGRLRGLDAHLRLRVCLRTLSPSDSISVLGSPVASKLPAAPGLAWLSRDGALTKIRVALADSKTRTAVVGDGNSVGGSAGMRVRPVCLPPLPAVLSLDALPGCLSAARSATAPVGLLDLPEHGRQPALVLDLTSGDAHLAIAGAPRSGRSTALATVVASLATTSSPKELSIHVITAAASPLAAVGGLPHVGTVATTPELARRVVLTVAAIVNQRQALGHSCDDRIVLVIDDLVTALVLDDEISLALGRIATVGLSVGVSLALSCARWLELRGGLREAIGTRWELRLNDPADSQLPTVARRVADRPPGRVLTSAGEWAQLALPRLNARVALVDVAPALSHLVAATARRGGPAARPIQLLPDLVTARSLPAAKAAQHLCVGVSGPYADAAEVPFGPGSHFLVLGNSRTGRSGLLRSIASSATNSGSRVWLIDPRLGLKACVDRSYRSASTSDEITNLVAALAAECRDPAPELAHRPVHLLIIDDLDLAEGRDGGSALTALTELLPLAADLGLTIIAARRVSGSGRAAYNAFYGRFLEFCDNGIVLSGDPAEGPVFAGLRPSRRPPGRGDLVIRGENLGELQTAWLDFNNSSVSGRSISAKMAIFDTAGCDLRPEKYESP
jgi:S-DNA-T family DNA segregation ATPase FtsK/SpoIIIE